MKIKNWKLKNWKLKIKFEWNHWMTVQVHSQPVTDQITVYIDMCCIINSISCLEKKMTVRNTWSDMLCSLKCMSKCHCVFSFLPPPCIYWVYIELRMYIKGITLLSQVLRLCRNFCCIIYLMNSTSTKLSNHMWYAKFKKINHFFLMKYMFLETHMIG